MIYLDLIKISEYLLLEDKSKYDFALRYAYHFTNPIDEYGVGDVSELPFGFVKDIQEELNGGLSFVMAIELLQQLVSVPLADEPLDKFSRFYNYIVKGISEINDAERLSLVEDSEPEEDIAADGLFDGLGVYLQIRKLTGGDVTKYDKVRDRPYSLCFTELYTQKKINEFQKNLFRLRLNK